MAFISWRHLGLIYLVVRLVVCMAQLSVPGLFKIFCYCLEVAFFILVTHLLAAKNAVVNARQLIC